MKGFLDKGVGIFDKDSRIQVKNRNDDEKADGTRVKE
jgi:hypothetical protein